MIWSTGSTYGSTRYFSAPARDSSVKVPCPRVCTLLALRRSPEARFTWRTSMPGSPSTATCPSKAERTSAVPKAIPRQYQVDDENHLQSRDTDCLLKPTFQKNFQTHGLRHEEQLLLRFFGEGSCQLKLLRASFLISAAETPNQAFSQ